MSWIPSAITAAGAALGAGITASESSKQTRKNRNESARQFDTNLDWLQTQYWDQANRQDYYYQDQKRKDEWLYWDQNRRQDEYAQNSAGWQMEDIMQTADEAGIHRLAALGGASGNNYQPFQSSGGGGGSTGGIAGAAPPTASYAGGHGPIMGDAIAEAAKAIANGYMSDHEKKMQGYSERQASAEAEIAEAQSRTLLAAERAKGLSGPATVSPEWDGRPKSAPWRDRIPVRMPDGETIAHLPKSVADRYMLKYMDQMTTGELNEITGEIVGEAKAIGSVGKNLEAAGIPVTGRNTSERTTNASEGSRSRKYGR